MKKISVLIFCLTATVFLVGGCAVWKDLNTPIRKRKKTPKLNKPAEPETLPDGSTVGLNKYEMEYLKDIDKASKRRQQQNYRKVFGGSGR